MPEWLQVADGGHELDTGVLSVRLALAAFVGLVIAGVFALSQRRPAREAIPLLTTLVLLTMLVAMTTIVIGDSVARAFSLVGALSLVRFRTVVHTSFSLFPLVPDMPPGAVHLLVSLIGVPLVSLIAIGMGAVGRAVTASNAQRLEIRIGAARDPQTLFADVFHQHLKSRTLVSVLSAKSGASIDVIYRVRLRDRQGMFALLRAIQSLEGVQSVELRDL